MTNNAKTASPAASGSPANGASGSPATGESPPRDCLCQVTWLPQQSLPALQYVLLAAVSSFTKETSSIVSLLPENDHLMGCAH